VEAIKHHEADAEAFAVWAMQSPRRVEAFAQAWRIWHDLSALSREHWERIEKIASVSSTRPK
jgi:ferric-dicitrate binding protein FerR (iron transport regulator)